MQGSNHKNTYTLQVQGIKLCSTLYAVGFEPYSVYFRTNFFYQGTLYTENSHTPPFLEILSITVLGITRYTCKNQGII